MKRKNKCGEDARASADSVSLKNGSEHAGASGFGLRMAKFVKKGSEDARTSVWLLVVLAWLWVPASATRPLQGPERIRRHGAMELGYKP